MPAHERTLYAAQRDAVQPDIGFPVYAVEIQEWTAAIVVPLVVEFFAVPEIRIEEGIGNLAPVVAKCRVGHGTGLYVIGEGGPGDACRKPVLRIELRRRYQLAIAGDFGGPSDLPATLRYFFFDRAQDLQFRKAESISRRIMHAQADITPTSGPERLPLPSVFGSLDSVSVRHIYPVRPHAINPPDPSKIDHHPFIRISPAHPGTCEMSRRKEIAQGLPVFKEIHALHPPAAFMGKCQLYAQGPCFRNFYRNGHLVLGATPAAGKRLLI